ncbi:hypothetical protein SDC9_199501 [bioreactor metagenome]|uniref:Uncharacterized protein n=1 Tax=bioreactor metagenome TaxID=1076179 RepID=A0A645IKP6_9ZZZZ
MVLKNPKFSLQQQNFMHSSLLFGKGGCYQLLRPLAQFCLSRCIIIRSVGFLDDGSHLFLSKQPLLPKLIGILDCFLQNLFGFLLISRDSILEGIGINLGLHIIIFPD